MIDIQSLCTIQCFLIPSLYLGFRFAVRVEEVKEDVFEMKHLISGIL